MATSFTTTQSTTFSAVTDQSQRGPQGQAPFHGGRELINGLFGQTACRTSPGSVCFADHFADYLAN